MCTCPWADQGSSHSPWFVTSGVLTHELRVLEQTFTNGYSHPWEPCEVISPGHDGLEGTSWGLHEELVRADATRKCSEANLAGAAS